MDSYNIVKNFPKEGVNFVDFSPLYRNIKQFNKDVEYLCSLYSGQTIDKVAAIESRGYILGTAIAMKMGVPLVLVRKRFKSPNSHYVYEVQNEYKENYFEIQYQDLEKGEKVILVDDVLATGETLRVTHLVLEKIFEVNVNSAMVLADIDFPRKSIELPIYSVYKIS